MKTLTHHLSERVRVTRERTRDRHEHDRAISDPRIRAEHDAGRARDVAAGGVDCHYCA